MSSAKDESYICRLCSKGFASSVALENHAKNQHFDTYSQGDTDKWYGGIIVSTAVTSSDKEESYICRLCSKGFASSVALENHAKNQHFDTYSQGDTDKWYGGIIISDVSSLPDDSSKAKKAPLSEKEKTELKKEEVLSSMSQAPITALAGINVGMIIMKQEEDDISPAVWQRKPKKKRNKSRIPPPPLGNSSICSQCGKQFLLRYKFLTHLRKAHKKLRQDVICDVCGKRFMYKSCLKRHIADHNMEVHSCPECPWTFSKYSALKDHYLDHSEIRYYACDICKRVLHAKNELDEHYSKVHSLKKPYQCHLCERTFNQEHSLKVHLNASHKESTIYTCKFCSNTFNDLQSLTLHENKSHRKRKRTSERNKCEQQGDDVEL